MAIADDIRTIYIEMGWRRTTARASAFVEDRQIDASYAAWEQPDGWVQNILPDPTLDTPEGLAEFARVLLWAWREFGEFQLCKVDDARPYIVSVETERFPEFAQEATPQEAFLSALAGAIRAKNEGKE